MITTSGVAYLQLFEMIADAAADPATAVTDFFEGPAEVLEATDYVDPCPIGTIAREVASTNDALRQATDHVFTSWIETAASRFTGSRTSTRRRHRPGHHRRGRARRRLRPRPCPP